jgi:hypothetical protein
VTIREHPCEGDAVERKLTAGTARYRAVAPAERGCGKPDLRRP